MADEADQANDLAEISLALALRARNDGPRLSPTGVCHYCEEPVEGDRKFCDQFCETSWRWEAQRKAANRTWS